MYQIAASGTCAIAVAILVQLYDGVGDKATNYVVELFLESDKRDSINEATL